MGDKNEGALVRNSTAIVEPSNIDLQGLGKGLRLMEDKNMEESATDSIATVIGTLQH